MKGAAQPDFSFSGLKTAVRQAAEAIAPLVGQDVADICASFQAAVSDALATASPRAWTASAPNFPTSRPALVVAGGVAANRRSARHSKRFAAELGFRFVAPPPSCAPTMPR